METLVASVVVQESLADSPLLMTVRSAEMLTVGLAAAGGGGGGVGGTAFGFLLQAATKRSAVEAIMRSERCCGECG
jgi:hypothetical protein